MAMLQAISAPFTKGVNFTNWLEFRSAQDVEENLYTRKDFENVAALGCDVVRLPIHFEKLCDRQNNYEIPEKILAILDRVLSWAEELKLYVIFDFHNNTHIDSVTSENVEEVLLPVWTSLAKRYKDASEYVIYELMNEPHGIDVEVWNRIILDVFQKVRGIDQKHYIIVGGADWNSFQGMCALPDFQDDKVIYTFHFYEPHTFTHQGAPWCHMERVVGIPFPYAPDRMPALPDNATEKEIECFENYPEEGTLERVIAFFDQYAEFSRQRKAPVYCGEFGCFAPCMDGKVRADWYRLIVGLLKERNIARTSWDYHGAFGIFNLKPGVRPGKRELAKFPEDLNMDIVRALDLNVVH